MQTFTLEATLDDQQRLVVKVPDELAAQVTEIVMQPVHHLSPEEVKQRLQADGLLANPDEIELDETALELPETELDAIGRLILAQKTVLDYINEDREERF